MQQEDGKRNKIHLYCNNNQQSIWKTNLRCLMQIFEHKRSIYNSILYTIRNFQIEFESLHCILSFKQFVLV